MSTIAIILLNYNSTRLTKKCVSSLLAHKEATDTYHIIVWDANSSIPPNKSEFQSCDLILSGKNLGFTGGNNEAVSYALRQYADTEYILLLNNDTRVTKGMIRQLVLSFEMDSEIGFILPKICFEKGHEFHKHDYAAEQKGRVLWYAGGGIDWANMIVFHCGVDEVDRGQFNFLTTSTALPPQRNNIGHCYETNFATGCCLLTTPYIWKKLKGFDKNYFLYYEDADLSVRVKKLGYKIVVDPTTTLYHVNAGSTDGGGSALHQYYQTRNRLRFGLQYGKMRAKIALLREAVRMYSTGSAAHRLGVVHALEGRWGNQTHKILPEKQ